MKRVSLHLADYHFEAFIKHKHKYFVSVAEALKSYGYSVSVHKILPDTKYVAGLLDDYAILDELLLKRENCFTIKRARFEPYWSVENRTTESEFRVYDKVYDPSQVDAEKAANFANLMRSEKLGFVDRINPRGEAVYVPLQNQLLKKRQYQTMSPLDMLRTIRENEPDRVIITTLRQGHNYSAEERDAFVRLIKELDIEHSVEPPETLIPKAHYVATINATTGFNSLLWGVPTMLFGDADYHHNCVNIKDFDKPADAFDAMRNKDPNSDRYLKWYLDDNMIDARKDDAAPRTMQYLAELGWKFPQNTKN